MTLLIRRIETDCIEELENAFEAKKLDLGPSDGVPIVAVRGFIPSVADKGELSVFLVADRADALRVAGAAVLTFLGMGKAKTLFLVANQAEVEAAGFKVTFAEGTLKNPVINAKHYTVSVATAADAERLARLFLPAEPFLFEAKTVKQEAQRAARHDEFDFVQLAAKPGSGTATYLVEFIKEHVVSVQGVPAS